MAQSKSIKKAQPVAAKPKPDKADTVEIFDTIGISGLQQSAGVVREEFLPQLRGSRGRKIYREMADNDPTVGAFLYLLDVLIQQVPWHVQAADSEAPLALEAEEFVEYERAHMKTKWADVVSDANSCFPFGWSFLETTYRRREDGWVGWYKMEGRAQDTLDHWDFDENGELQGLIQRKPGGMEKVYVPIAKGLHFRTKISKGNPEGRSILRNAYRPWYFLKHIQEIEAVGIERDLAGLPVMRVPKKILMDGASAGEVTLRNTLLQLASRVRRDEQEAMIIPNKDDGFDFELLASAGKRQFDTVAVKQGYKVDILMSVLAELLMLGMDKVGTNALGAVKAGFLTLAIEAYLVRMRDVFNGALMQLMELNPKFPKEVWPTFEFGDVDAVDVQAFSDGIAKLVGAAVITPDEGIEKRVREVLGLPPPPEDLDAPELGVPKPKPKPATASGGTPDDPMDPADEGS